MKHPYTKPSVTSQPSPLATLLSDIMVELDSVDETLDSIVEVLKRWDATFNEISAAKLSVH